METKVVIIWLMSLVAVISCVGLLVMASMQNTKVRADATVAKAKEHTTRAEGRHQLVDFLGLLRRDAPAR